MANKPKMMPEEIINKIKNEKGIKFNRISEEEAAKYLSEKNNYFRLASYRKNYDKYLNGPNEGKYIDLDFADLVELSTIDMHLRFLVIKMCLDIEHCLKIRLLAHIASNSVEDGYEIVQAFLDSRQWVIEDIYKKRRSTYIGDLINSFFTFESRTSNAGKIIFEKVESRCPIWALMEILGFGEFIEFYDFYYGMYTIPENLTGILRPIKSLRNACAHNNCVIHNLRKGSTHPGPKISKFISNITDISTDERRNKLRIRPLYELICVLFAYDNVVSEALKKRRYEELSDLVNIRMLKHANYFEGQQVIAAAYNFLKKVVDFLT